MHSNRLQLSESHDANWAGFFLFFSVIYSTFPVCVLARCRDLLGFLWGAGERLSLPISQRCVKMSKCLAFAAHY